MNDQDIRDEMKKSVTSECKTCRMLGHFFTDVLSSLHLFRIQKEGKDFHEFAKTRYWYGLAEIITDEIIAKKDVVKKMSREELIIEKKKNQMAMLANEIERLEKNFGIESLGENP